ncbi:hypothetical protein BpHYR1_040066 [Brachionus plicatilis]|uniref:Uncharacterized protein n=1 Tax=Brachionus plicatilis TaxID=10195 RepID=A0A3M7QL88_BRAPC|nr:hypothetical protein BpHYR1_040066 [Brachionus plicatilis]
MISIKVSMLKYLEISTKSEGKDLLEGANIFFSSLKNVKIFICNTVEALKMNILKCEQPYK